MEVLLGIITKPLRNHLTGCRLRPDGSGVRPGEEEEMIRSWISGYLR
jgi:hypothetical protein